MVGADYPLRGQIWEYILGSRQYRVLILTNDEYNETPRARPWAAMVERTASSGHDHLVELSEGDPLPGAVVVVPLVLRCDKSALRRALGFVANDTLNAVERELREFLVLP